MKPQSVLMCRIILKRVTPYERVFLFIFKDKKEKPYCLLLSPLLYIEMLQNYGVPNALRELFVLFSTVVL